MRRSWMGDRNFILNANDEIRHRNDTGYKNSIKEIIAGLDD
ncbi:hypothetical protein KKH3_14570 [Pectobacterium actinidiae]|nr:hypothetical protein KKH3_14570 [Pectobacterium actinidiae]